MQVSVYSVLLLVLPDASSETRRKQISKITMVAGAGRRVPQIEFGHIQMEFYFVTEEFCF
jgi:hypothetical protein